MEEVYSGKKININMLSIVIVVEVVIVIVGGWSNS